MEATFLCPIDDNGRPVIPPRNAVGPSAMAVKDIWNGIHIVHSIGDGYDVGEQVGEKITVTFYTSPDTIATLETDPRFERVS